MFPKYEQRSNPIYVSSQKTIHHFPARFHKQLEMLYVISGELRANIDGKSYYLQAGQMYIAFPNILHAVLHSNATGLLIIADNEMFPLYTEALNHFKPEKPVISSADVPPIVFDCLNRVQELNRQEDFPHRQVILTGYISAVLGEILKQIHLTERNSDSDLIQKLILYLLDNYTREITLEDLARALSYSKCYISRLISETFQCNFRSLINSYRISLAQSLLLSSQKTVTEISYECGFKNQSSFNRIFLKNCAETPSDFRKRHDMAVDKPQLYLR